MTKRRKRSAEGSSGWRVVQARPRWRVAAGSAIGRRTTRSVPEGPTAAPREGSDTQLMTDEAPDRGQVLGLEGDVGVDPGGAEHVDGESTQP